MSRLILGAIVLFLSAPVAVETTAGMQVNITGEWQFTVELDIGGGEPTFVFEQDGETLTGSYEGLFGTAAITGTVKGNQIEFRFGGDGAEAVYVGSIDGDLMQGTCDYGGVGEGSWEAERQR